MTGKRVRCVDASEPDIPIKAGQVYTVARSFIGRQDDTEAPIPGMEKTPGYVLKEVAGYFRADRFEEVP